jgi:hypothetical protein
MPRRSRGQDKHEQPEVITNWRLGPRPGAWDALWRRILEDVLPTVTTAARSNSGAEPSGQAARPAGGDATKPLCTPADEEETDPDGGRYDGKV